MEVDKESKYRDSYGDLTPAGYWLFAKLVLGLIVVLWIVFGSIRTVGVGQIGVVTRLGQVNRELNSGVSFKFPWPIEKLDKFDVKTQKDEAVAAAASQDLQDVTAKVVTNYHLEAGKVGELYRTVGTDYKARLIDPAIQESLKSTTSKYAVADLIVRRAEVKEAALTALKARLAPRGIIIEDLSLTDLNFSQAFTQAIEAKQVAEQQAQQAKYLAEKATNEAAAQVATARGQAESQAIVQSTLTPELLQKMSIEKWNGALPQVTSGATPFVNLK
jgi:regulator of protease activity HflC (stomatin/prohibitin superfamily)